MLHVLQNPHDIGHVLLVADGCADVANKVAAIAASILGMFLRLSDVFLVIFQQFKVYYYTRLKAIKT